MAYVPGAGTGTKQNSFPSGSRIAITRGSSGWISVARVAPMLKVTAKSEDGVVEGLELRDDARGALPFLLSVQFHPERLADRYPAHEAIFGAFSRACALQQNKL